MKALSKSTNLWLRYNPLIVRVIPFNPRNHGSDTMTLGVTAFLSSNAGQ
jgi:hypothetical protein